MICNQMILNYMGLQCGYEWSVTSKTTGLRRMALRMYKYTYRSLPPSFLHPMLPSYSHQNALQVVAMFPGSLKTV